MTTIKERPPWLADIARDLPALMTVEQVATTLHVHPKTVRKRIAAHTLRAVRSVGSSHYLIPRDALLDWLAARAVV